MKTYIDVSSRQGVIDWEKVRGHIDGVILRAGEGNGFVDTQFYRNANECNRLGIPCGAYWYSFASTKNMAAKEARHLIDTVKMYKMELPLVFSYEHESVNYNIRQGIHPDARLAASMVNGFMDVINSCGYYGMLYANNDFINRYFKDVFEKYDLWLSEWPDKDEEHIVEKREDPSRKCGIWEYGKIQVNGIYSGEVDVSQSFNDYPKLLRQKGKNHLSPDEPTPPTPPTPPEPWYAGVMQWAKTNKIHDGTRPNDPATRAEVTQMIYNYFKMRK